MASPDAPTAASSPRPIARLAVEGELSRVPGALVGIPPGAAAGLSATARGALAVEGEVFGRPDAPLASGPPGVDVPLSVSARDPLHRFEAY